MTITQNTPEDLKAFQVKINRYLADSFKKYCIDRGTTQKQQVEKWITSAVDQHQQRQEQ